jgi:hypothetical protein
MPAGAALRAIVTVDGERLESQSFTVPSSGGLRILLAAGLGVASGPASAPTGADAPALPAAPGSLTLSGQSRIVLELAEESIEVFCLIDIVNPAGRAVTLSAPIVFELPAGAASASTLEGSSPLARVEKTRVTVAGPLPAGATSLQFAYRLATPTSALHVRQAFPLAAPQLTAIVRKLGSLSVTMTGERGRRDVPMEGRTYQVLSGGALPAGGAVDLALEGLPTHAGWPRYLALGLAALVVMIGVWAATSGAQRPDWEAEGLRVVRAARFDELLALERRAMKKSSPDEAQVARRTELVDQIAELDLALEALRLQGVARPAGESSDAVSAGTRASAVQ